MEASTKEVYTVYNKYLERHTACQVAYLAPPAQKRQPVNTVRPALN